MMSKTNFSVDKNTLTVTRTFDAPLKSVWRAWTDPELLDQWWAPSPWKSETKRMEFKEGGSRLYAMVGPKGEEHWGLTEYESIVEPEKFSGKDSFCDEEGNVNAALPVARFLNSFAGLPDQTEVTITTEYPSEEDLKKVIEMGMKEGLSSALDNLDRLLEAVGKKE